MLEGLDQVDWGRLTDAYGSAEHVPDDLRSLVSHDCQVREQALRRLDGSICHQGSRYRASAPAVPFLFEVLMAPDATSKDEIIELLVRLAISHPIYHLPFGFDPTKEFRAADRLARRIDPKQLRASQPEEDEELDEGVAALWARDAYEAVEREVEAFQKLTRDADETVRRASVRSLAWFPRAAAHSAPVVRAVAWGGRSPGEQANAILSLGILDRYLRDLSDIPALERLLELGHPPSVRLAAAISLGVILEARLPDAALAVLEEALESGLEDGESDGESGWDFSGPVAMAAGLLAAIRPKPTSPLVSALCRAAATNDTGARPSVWMALLSVVFRRPKAVKWLKDASQPNGLRAEYVDPLKLTRNQVRALQAIGRNPIWDRMNPLHDQHMDVCEAFGVPRHHEKLLALAAAAEQREK